MFLFLNFRHQHKYTFLYRALFNLRSNYVVLGRPCVKFQNCSSSQTNKLGICHFGLNSQPKSCDLYNMTIFSPSWIKRFFYFRRFCNFCKFLFCVQNPPKNGSKVGFWPFLAPIFKVIGCKYKHEILGIISKYMHHCTEH